MTTGMPPDEPNHPIGVGPDADDTPADRQPGARDHAADTPTAPGTEPGTAPSTDLGTAPQRDADTQPLFQRPAGRGALMQKATAALQAGTRTPSQDAEAAAAAARTAEGSPADLPADLEDRPYSATASAMGSSSEAARATVAPAALVPLAQRQAAAARQSPPPKRTPTPFQQRHLAPRTPPERPATPVMARAHPTPAREEPPSPEDAAAPVGAAADPHSHDFEDGSRRGDVAGAAEPRSHDAAPSASGLRQDRPPLAERARLAQNEPPRTASPAGAQPVHSQAPPTAAPPLHERAPATPQADPTVTTPPDVADAGPPAAPAPPQAWGDTGEIPADARTQSIAIAPTVGAGASAGAAAPALPYRHPTNERTAAPSVAEQAAAAPVVLDVRTVTFKLKGKRILRNVDFAIAEGEILVLLGPNGAGKSTLAKNITGRFRPETGRVRVAGADPATDASARAAIGIVPQHVAIYPKLTGLENLIAFGRLMGLNRHEADTRARQGLRRVGLEERAHARVETLSGGMQRRVNIAAALLHEPKLLVLDEPTVGVDLASRQALAQVLRDLRDEGLAILLTTHDLTEAETLADRIAVLVAGEIVAVGTPDDVIHHAFGGRRMVTISPMAVRGADDEALKAAAVGSEAFMARRLRDAALRMGLTTPDDGLTWSGLVDVNDPVVRGAMTDVLAAAPMSREVRMRRPGLDALLEHLAPSSSGSVQSNPDDAAAETPRTP